jgi:hypothetical protein
MATKEQRYRQLLTTATSYVQRGNICSDPGVPLCKLNYLQNIQRSSFENHDSCIMSNDSDPVDLADKAAREGSWLLVSTVRFPQFWKRVCDRLVELEAKGAIDDSFRLIFDLQGYSQSDISDSFIFDHAVTFHLSEQNAEELDGFDDIWSTILDERVLLKLEEKIDGMKDLIVEESKPKPPKEEGTQSAEVSEEDESSLRTKQPAEPESPSNFKLVDRTIKSPAQIKMYKQFMSDSKQRNQGLRFDLQKAAAPSSDASDHGTDQEGESKAHEDSLHSGLPREESSDHPPLTHPSSLRVFTHGIS